MLPPHTTQHTPPITSLNKCQQLASTYFLTWTSTIISLSYVCPRRTVPSHWINKTTRHISLIRYIQYPKSYDIYLMGQRMDSTVSLMMTGYEGSNASPPPEMEDWCRCGASIGAGGWVGSCTPPHLPMHWPPTFKFVAPPLVWWRSLSKSRPGEGG